jgi:hypothetical protein
MSNEQKATNDEKATALVLAQKVLQHNGLTMNYRDRASLHTFIERLSNGETRNKVTMHECLRVVNIARRNP